MSKLRSAGPTPMVLVTSRSAKDSVATIGPWMLHQSAAYETAALPLSYSGSLVSRPNCRCVPPRVGSKFAAPMPGRRSSLW